MPQTPVSSSAVASGLLADLGVQPEATTSRTVVNNEVLRVVAFAMDAGQELTEHSSTRAVTVHVVDGTLTFTVDGTAHDLVAGDLVYLAPGARHSVQATSPCHFLLVMVFAA